MEEESTICQVKFYLQLDFIGRSLNTMYAFDLKNVTSQIF